MSSEDRRGTGGSAGYATAEYVVFAVPQWCVPLFCVMGLMWLVANKSQWEEIPAQLWFLAGTLVGLIALTRVLLRRQKGRYAIGIPTALMLVAGLIACVSPLMRLDGTEDSAGVAITWAFAWPTPIYLHWLVSGLRHRFASGDE